MVLTANYTTVGPGAAVVLTATVTPTVALPSGSTPDPTGTVIFYDGTAAIGSATLTAVPNTDYSTATFTTQTLPGGSDSITAVYQGDTNYGSSTSNLLTITIQGFTLTPSPYNPPENLDIVQGGAGAESFIVTSVDGYTSPVQVICTVATQDDMTCAVSPQQVTPSATVTFVVQTYVTGGPEYATTLKPQKPNSLWPGAAGGAALAALVFFLLPFGRRARIFLRQGPRRFLVLLMLLAGLVGSGRRLHQHCRAHALRNAFGRFHAQGHGNRLYRQRCNQPKRLLHRQRDRALSGWAASALPRPFPPAVLGWHFTFRSTILHAFQPSLSFQSCGRGARRHDRARFSARFSRRHRHSNWRPSRRSPPPLPPAALQTCAACSGPPSTTTPPKISIRSSGPSSCLTAASACSLAWPTWTRA